MICRNEENGNFVFQELRKIKSYLSQRFAEMIYNGKDIYSLINTHVQA